MKMKIAKNRAKNVLNEIQVNVFKIKLSYRLPVISDSDSGIAAAFAGKNGTSHRHTLLTCYPLVEDCFNCFGQETYIPKTKKPRFTRFIIYMFLSSDTRIALQQLEPQLDLRSLRFPFRVSLAVPQFQYRSDTLVAQYPKSFCTASVIHPVMQGAVHTEALLVG